MIKTHHCTFNISYILYVHIYKSETATCMVCPRVPPNTMLMLPMRGGPFTQTANATREIDRKTKPPHVTAVGDRPCIGTMMPWGLASYIKCGAWHRYAAWVEAPPHIGSICMALGGTCGHFHSFNFR